MYLNISKYLNIFYIFKISYLNMLFYLLGYGISLFLKELNFVKFMFVLDFDSMRK